MLAKLTDFNGTVEYVGVVFKFHPDVSKWILFLLVLFEMMVVFFLLKGSGFQRIFYQMTGLALILFSLISVWMGVHGFENCGCFGTKIPVRPLPTLIKNVIMILMLEFLRILEEKKYYES